MRKRRFFSKTKENKKFILEMTHFLSHPERQLQPVPAASLDRQNHYPMAGPEGLSAITDSHLLITCSPDASPRPKQTLIRIDADLLRSLNTLLDNMASIHAKYGCPFDTAQVYRCIGASLMWIEQRRQLGFHWTPGQALRLIAADLLNHLQRCLAGKDNDPDSPRRPVGFWPDLPEMCL